MTEDELERLAREAGERLAAAGHRLATAESCTGGWIAKCLTDVPGSSAWFGWGFVTYANDAKTALVGVPESLLAEQGAVSEAVVVAMAEGALQVAGADEAVAVSGVAGPDGGTPDKPVGTVWLAWARRDEQGFHTVTVCRRFDGDREAVRRQTVAAALEGLAQ
jgi:nicotinamide-nucleotide amidase